MRMDRKTRGQRAAKNVTKSVSLPSDMARAVDQRIATDPELDWSKYVRRLIREDVGRSTLHAQ